MDSLPNSVLIVLLFILRLGVPLLITLAIGYVLGRLDAKWQAEAEAERQAEMQAQAAKAQTPLKPSAPAAPYQLPARQPLAGWAMAGTPCWSLKGCTEATKAACPATRQPSVPCWAARLNAEGQLPQACQSCQLYDPRVFDPKTMQWIGQQLVH